MGRSLTATCSGTRCTPSNNCHGKSDNGLCALVSGRAARYLPSAQHLQQGQPSFSLRYEKQPKLSISSQRLMHHYRQCSASQCGDAGILSLLLGEVEWERICITDLSRLSKWGLDYLMVAGVLPARRAVDNRPNPALGFRAWRSIHGRPTSACGLESIVHQSTQYLANTR